MKPETAAAFSLLSAKAVRERAHRLLAIGLDGRAAAFPRRSRPARCGGGPRRRDHARGLSRARRAVPRALAALRGRAAATAGREIDRATAWRDASERARAAFDLAIVSVLLDAGAGPRWAYRDAASGETVGRSEGLALASLAMFADGAFSSDPRRPLRADASGAAAPDQRRPGPALPGDRRQPAGGPRRPRRPAPPARRDGRGQARGLRARR